MSASQEKKRRREERAEGVDKKTVAKNKTARSKKRNRIITTIVAIVLVVVVLFLIVMNSSLFYSQVGAVKIGSRSFSADEYNYFYQNALYSEYNSIYQSMGEYTSYFMDLEKLDTQTSMRDSEKTWSEYLEDQALKGMQETVALCDAAKADGYVLTDDDKSMIDSNVSSAKSAASDSGNNFKTYLSAVYGRGFTEDMYRKLVTDQVMAVSYRQVLLDRWTSGYTDTLLADKYEEIADQYDLFTFCSYFVSGEADEENGLTADAAMNAAHDTATTISAGKTEEVFLELVRDSVAEEEQANYSSVDSVLRSNVSAQSLQSAAYLEWMTAHDRVYGDTTVVESGSGYYVLLWIGRNHNDYHLRSFRHILVQITYDEESGSGLDALSAQTKANQLYEEWQSDPTEEHFAEMANANSDDTGSNTTGGLYTDVQMGQMVKPIEDWLFDEARQPGDSTVVYASSSNYSGYHVVYYVGEDGHPYNTDLATSAQQNDDYSAWLEGKAAEYPINKLFAFRFTK